MSALPWHRGPEWDMIGIMSNDLIKRLAALSRRMVELAPEEALFRAGDRVTMLYLVTEGAVRLERITPRGARLILQRATAGEVLAEASCFADAYHCDAVATTRSRLSALPLRTFRQACAADPALLAALAAHLARSVQDARARAEILSLKTVEARTRCPSRASPSTASYQKRCSRLVSPASVACHRLISITRSGAPFT